MCTVLSGFFCSVPHLYLLFLCYLMLQFPLPTLGGKSSLPGAALREKDIFPDIMVYLVGSPVDLQTVVITLSSASLPYLDAAYMQLLFSPLVSHCSHTYVNFWIVCLTVLCPHNATQCLHTVLTYIASVCLYSSQN